MAYTDSIICPDCKKENRFGAKHCVACGVKLPLRESILQTLQKLNDHSSKIAQFFPANLPDKEAKLTIWQKQINRAQQCFVLLGHELLKEPMLQEALDQGPVTTLANAVFALDFTHEYTVKLLGPTGTGKSSLLNAILGRDILPTGQASAVTGVPIRIVLCNIDEQPKEELLVHFLKREDFDKQLQETATEAQKEAGGQTKAVEPNAVQQQEEQDKPFTLEYKRLIYLKENKESKSRQSYVDTYLHDPFVLSFSEDKWEEGRNFIMEPPKKEGPYLARLVDYAEFRIHAPKDSVLPEGSVWVDLPGGYAGQMRHDQILSHELQNLDAVILTAGGERYDDDRTIKIFGQVRNILWQKFQDIAPQMVFIAATNWDKNGTDEDRERAKAGMRALLGKFPTSYQTHHSHHFPIDKDKEYLPYYPSIPFGARMAMLGRNGNTLNNRQQQEISNYRAVITNIYDMLKQFDAKLTGNSVAEEFKDFPHDAVYKLSGLPELVDDLQVFLTRQRYEGQLQQSIVQLNLAYRHIEDICWDYINSHGFSGRELQKLKGESRRRLENIQSNRSEYLAVVSTKMRLAWERALEDYEIARTQPLNRNSFYTSLTHAYNQAVLFLKRRIEAKDFDHFVEISNYTRGEHTRLTWTISPEEDAVEVRGIALRAELRSKLAGVLDQTMQGQPAEELADMFLASVNKQGDGTGGAFDIKNMTLGVNDKDLEELNLIYIKMLDDLTDIARQVCRFVAVSELFNKEYKLGKNHQLMHKFNELTNSTVAATGNQNQVADIKASEDILEEARAIMKQMVVALSSNLVEHVFHRITFIYRNELEKLNVHTIYDVPSLKGQAYEAEPGRFTAFATKWYHTMVALLYRSDTLRLSIDNYLASEPIIDFDKWSELIEEIRTQRGAT